MGRPEGTVTVREISEVHEVRRAAALLDAIWRGKRVLSPELLRALATHGALVLGAFRDDEMVGTQMGFLGLDPDGAPFLHSHVTGVAPGLEHGGIGLALKRAQRDWCLARGIGTVTWTFDPMIARNAYFNLSKLAAEAHAFHRDFYGPMEDVLNAGERSDRVEVRWDLRSPRVVDALAGRPPAPE
ncbi:MAG: GNAT family N-acetyltransferase, partial [Actinomycetota bacterium]|nr:GNAT family N-acetyltransferase [Actinomycetota bacterium]